MQFYDWTTTVASAVEQLAGQIGLVNYKDYTLFEARKVSCSMWCTTHQTRNKT